MQAPEAGTWSTYSAHPHPKPQSPGSEGTLSRMRLESGCGAELAKTGPRLMPRLTLQGEKTNPGLSGPSPITNVERTSRVIVCRRAEDQVGEIYLYTGYWDLRTMRPNMVSNLQGNDCEKRERWRDGERRVLSPLVFGR